MNSINLLFRVKFEALDANGVGNAVMANGAKRQ